MKVSEEMLMHPNTEWVEVQSVLAGTAVKYVTNEFPNGYIKTDEDMVRGHYIRFDQTTPHLEEVRAAMTKHLRPRCTVDGVVVEELAVLVKPVGFLVTTSNGTHEITRCFYQKDRFTYGVDVERLGGLATESVEYQPEHGMRIHFAKGYEMFVPASHCQATWKLPDPA